MNQIEHIMALADEYSYQRVANERDMPSDPFAARQALRTAIEQALGARVPEMQQIAEDLRFHGLTLVKTATGYAVLKLGAIEAQSAPQPQPDHFADAGKPMEREWVDLTPKEVREMFEDGLGFEPTWTIYQEISAKLREKNGGTK